MRDSVKGKVVIITGASSGIGEACAKLFAENGATLVLCARSLDKLEILAQKLSESFGIEVFSGKVDVRNLKEVNHFLEKVKEKFGQVDILINNAGLALGLDKFHNNDIDDWDIMIDTNIKGLLYFTKITMSLLMNNDGGHIINIGSLAGIASYPKGAVYCATKAAVKIISDGLRQDVVDKPIKVTTIQPGMVETNFSVVRFHGDEEKASGIYNGIQPLTAEDIADIIYYAASAPKHVQICEVTVTPTHQATGGVVHKKV